MDNSPSSSSEPAAKPNDEGEKSPTISNEGLDGESHEEDILAPKNEQSYITPPLNPSTAELIIGEKKGIEWFQNSCYIDATLFAMFSFDDGFDTLLQLKYDENCNSKETSENAQKILKNQIVNPLRKGEMVSSDAVMALRKAMQHLNQKFVSDLMEPQEFLMALFHDMFYTEPLLKLSNGNGEDYFHTILFENPLPMGMRAVENLFMPPLEKLLAHSLISQEVRFQGDDFPVLMLALPISFVTNENGEIMVDKPFTAIVPNLLIDLTKFIDFQHKCYTCSSINACYIVEAEGEGLTDKFLCEPCSKTWAEDPDVGNLSSPRPIESKYLLSAVICVAPNSRHFVSLVKCGPELNAPWVYFDSMGGKDGLSPVVRYLENFGKTVLKLERYPCLIVNYLEYGDESIKRFLRFPYMYIYKKKLRVIGME